ncbi:MAG TPA: response regulator [Nitrososphaera sp.]|nr:response regulator [Nitrososphaera sp.]
MTQVRGSEKSGMFGVLYVDMVSSTYNMANLHESDYAPYYKIFYDAISAIAMNFDGRVIKYIGDALLIHFPDTSDAGNVLAFRHLLACAMEMIGVRCSINESLRKRNLLLPLSFRISADYGRMEYIETGALHVADWIGPSMNMVAKINRTAQANSMVIGGDLHQILSKFSLPDYEFGLAGELDIGIKQRYPVYSVVAKTRNARQEHHHNHSHDTPLFNLSYKHNNIASNRDSPPATADSRRRIVIVDDEEDVLLAFSEYLSGSQFDVETFSDPMRLLERLSNVGPSYYDLAILDMRMPKMNGLRIYQLLDALRPGIKTLFVTAIADAEEMLCLLKGFSKADILKKPVRRDHLIAAVKEKIKVYA